MEKLIKLSFSTLKYWKSFEETLYTGEGEDKRRIKGVVEIYYLGHLQLPPKSDWQPDPNKPEDNGWTLSTDFCTDILVAEDFDYSGWSEYIAKCPCELHRIDGCECEVVCNEVKPDSTWLKADIQVWLTEHNIEWSKGMTKSELLNLMR